MALMVLKLKQFSGQPVQMLIYVDSSTAVLH